MHGTEIITTLSKYIPIVADRARKDPYQILIFTKIGVIYVWDEAATFFIDGKKKPLSDFIHSFNANRPIEINIVFEHEKIILRLTFGELRVSSSPQGYESLTLLTERRENLIF